MLVKESGFSLSNIAMLKDGVSRSISAENPYGKKGAGGKESSYLGKSRKGRPFINLPQGQEVVLAQIDEQGVLNSFWITCSQKTDKGYYVLRDLVLRMYWDDEEEPSVEVPLGDFFCNGFGARCKVNSMPIVVNPTGGMNCYFTMPFRKSAKITIANEHPCDVGGFFYQFNYTLCEVQDNAAYFHAQWRRENITQAGRDYTIVDNISGKGHFVGTYLAWATLERFWWGEGEIKFFIDGDKDYPTICGTGTEDYFGGAWCFYEVKEDGKLEETIYSTPYLGYPYYSNLDECKVYLDFENTYTRKGEKLYDVLPKHGLYRWHIMDPIIFNENLKITIQQIGHDTIEMFERTDDISSVAYWYQTEPHGKFPMLPNARNRWPR